MAGSKPDAKIRMMHADLRRFGWTVLVLWVVLATAGSLFAYTQSIPPHMAAPIVAAALIEVAFFLLPGFAGLRNGIRERLSRGRIAIALAASALLPYGVFAIGTGVFSWEAFGLLAALVFAVAFWYLLPEPRPWRDLLFLALMAAPILLRLFRWIYTEPFPKTQTSFLGQLMWIRMGVLAVLVLRGSPEAGFGFIPRREDWRVGLLHYLAILTFVIPLALFTGFARFQPVSPVWWRVAAGTFFGILWVVALSEEFFFRGLLQHWLTDWLRSPVASLIIASLAFGAVHLPFRSFPNWNFAALAAISGIFYGLAFRRARSIRAAMVAHALTVTTWRVLFV
jgi:uncharacterized protein